MRIVLLLVVIASVPDFFGQQVKAQVPPAAEVLPPPGAFSSHDTIQAWTEYIRNNPYDPSGYKRRGVALAAQGKWPVAIRDYGESLRLQPVQADVYTLRGIARYYMPVPGGGGQNYDRARYDFESATYINPHFTDAHYWLGQSFWKLANAERDAAKNEKKASEKNKRLDNARKYYRDAIFDLVEALHLCPTFPGAWESLAQVQLDLAGVPQNEKVNVVQPAPETKVTLGGKLEITIKLTDGTPKQAPQQPAPKANPPSLNFNLQLNIHSHGNNMNSNVGAAKTSDDDGKKGGKGQAAGDGIVLQTNEVTVKKDEWVVVPVKSGKAQKATAKGLTVHTDPGGHNLVINGNAVGNYDISVEGVDANGNKAVAMLKVKVE